LKNHSRYLAILTEGIVTELRHQRSEVTLLFSFKHPAGWASEQLHEFQTTGMARVIQAMTRHRVRPLRIELRRAAACPMLEQRLGVPVVVDQRTSP
jgi:hypothetical protein